MAATRRSFAFVVVTGPVLVALLFPVRTPVTSTGFVGSSPPYSTARTSGQSTGCAKVTVIAFDAAATMFLA
jgi:hypothetical protein